MPRNFYRPHRVTILYITIGWCIFNTDSVTTGWIDICFNNEMGKKNKKNIKKPENHCGDSIRITAEWGRPPRRPALRCRCPGTPEWRSPRYEGGFLSESARRAGCRPSLKPLLSAGGTTGASVGAEQGPHVGPTGNLEIGETNRGEGISKRGNDKVEFEHKGQCATTLAAKTLLLFFSFASEAAKSTTFPTLHLEQKNMGRLPSLASLGRNTWRYVLSVCTPTQDRYKVSSDSIWKLNTDGREGNTITMTWLHRKGIVKQWVNNIWLKKQGWRKIQSDHITIETQSFYLRFKIIIRVLLNE